VYHYKFGVDLIRSGLCMMRHEVNVRPMPPGFQFSNITIKHPPITGVVGQWNLSDPSSLAITSYRGAYKVVRNTPTRFEIAHVCQRRGPDLDGKPFPGFAEFIGEKAATEFRDAIAYRIQVEVYGPVGVKLPY
jgi:hypothetical protein